MLTLRFYIPSIDEDEVLVFLMGCWPDVAWAGGDLHGNYDLTVMNPAALPRIRAQIKSQFPTVRFLSTVRV